MTGLFQFAVAALAIRTHDHDSRQPSRVTNRAPPKHRSTGRMRYMIKSYSTSNYE